MLEMALIAAEVSPDTIAERVDACIEVVMRRQPPFASFASFGTNKSGTTVLMYQPKSLHCNLFRSSFLASRSPSGKLGGKGEEAYSTSLAYSSIQTRAVRSLFRAISSPGTL